MKPGGWKVLLSSAVGVVVTAGLIVGLTRSADDGGATLVTGGPSLDGAAALPQVAGPALDDGAPIKLADLKGKTVVLNAWASWCKPCREEGPDILRFSQDYPDVVVVGVNLNDEKASAVAFNAELGWTHRSIYDPKGVVGFDTLKIATLPATIYIDKAGVERGRTPGLVTYEDLASVARRLN